MNDSLLNSLSNNLLKNIMTYIVPYNKNAKRLAKHYISSIKSQFINNIRNRRVFWIKNTHENIHTVKLIQQLDYQALWKLYKYITPTSQMEILSRIREIMKSIQKFNIYKFQTYITNLKTNKVLNDQQSSTPLEFFNFMVWWYQFNSVGYLLKINTCEMEVTQAFHSFYNWFKKQSFNLDSMINHEINQVSKQCNSFLLPIKPKMNIYKTNTCCVGEKDTRYSSTYIIRFTKYDIYIEFNYVLNNNGKHKLIELSIYVKTQQGKLFDLFISEDMHNPLPIFQFLKMNPNKKYIDQFIFDRGFQNNSEEEKKKIWMSMTFFYIHFFELVDLNECKRINQGLCLLQYVFKN